MPCQTYKRVALKLSGEALAGDQGYGIDPEFIISIANELKKCPRYNAGGNSYSCRGAATFSAVWPVVRKAWTVELPTIWEC